MNLLDRYNNNDSVWYRKNKEAIMFKRNYKPNSAQVKMSDILDSNKNRNIALIGHRQIGMSTFIADMTIREAIENPNSNQMIVCKNINHVNYMRATIMGIIRSVLIRSHVHDAIYLINGSRIYITTSEYIVGRSVLHGMHIENSFIDTTELIDINELEEVLSILATCGSRIISCSTLWHALNPRDEKYYKLAVSGFNINDVQDQNVINELQGMYGNRNEIA